MCDFRKYFAAARADRSHPVQSGTAVHDDVRLLGALRTHVELVAHRKLGMRGSRNSEQRRQGRRQTADFSGIHVSPATANHEWTAIIGPTRVRVTNDLVIAPQQSARLLLAPAAM